MFVEIFPLNCCIPGPFILIIYYRLNFTIHLPCSVKYIVKIITHFILHCLPITAGLDAFLQLYSILGRFFSIKK